MKAEYINPFILAMLKVFETMVSCGLERGAPTLKRNCQPSHEVSAVIGLSGKAKGTVVLSVDREVALQVASILLGERPDQINADVADAMGEMTNMIAGRAKAQLEQYAMSISLPTVITGKGHCVEFPTKVKPICIPFTCPWGALTLEVALIEETAADQA